MAAAILILAALSVSLGARGGYATLSLDHQTHTSDLTLDRSGLEVAVFVGMDL